MQHRSGHLAGLLMLAGAVPQTLGQAPAPAAPNLTMIRRNATISPIDAKSVQGWVDQQLDALFSSNNLDADAPKFRGAMLEHYQATNATPEFRKVLAEAVVNSLSRHYDEATALANQQLPRPLPVVYTLAVLELFDDPSAIRVFQKAMKDKSDPPAPGVRATALHGLIRLRERMNAQTWTALVADVQKVAVTEMDPVVLQCFYRLLSVDAPEPRAQEGVTAVLHILDTRLAGFEQKGHVPSLAEREVATWLGARGVAMRTSPKANDIARSLGRLLADTAFAFVNLPHKLTPGRKEQLERIILAADQSLQGIAKARAAGRPTPDVGRALLAGGANQGKGITDEVNKWIGTTAAPAGFLNAAPFSLPPGLGIQRVVPATATASAPG